MLSGPDRCDLVFRRPLPHHYQPPTTTTTTTTSELVFKHPLSYHHHQTPPTTTTTSELVFRRPLMSSTRSSGIPSRTTTTKHHQQPPPHQSSSSGEENSEDSRRIPPAQSESVHTGQHTCSESSNTPELLEHRLLSPSRWNERKKSQWRYRPNSGRKSLLFSYIKGFFNTFFIMTDKTYHLDTQCASSTTIAHTRLRKRGPSKASHHLEYTMASGEHFSCYYP